MCFGDGGAAERARQDAAQTQAAIGQQQQERQTRIKTGQGSIDQAFSQFNQPYFDQYRNDYTASRNPEIDSQFNNAQDKMTATLEDRGLLRSTVGANSIGELNRQRDVARGNVANEAFDLANGFKQSVDKSKGDLYALNTASADPSLIATQAQGASTALIPPQATKPLGDLFASVLAPVAAYAKGSMYAPGGYGRPGYSSAPPTSGGGTSSIQR